MDGVTLGVNVVELLCEECQWAGQQQNHKKEQISGLHLESIFYDGSVFLWMYI